MDSEAVFEGDVTDLRRLQPGHVEGVQGAAGDRLDYTIVLDDFTQFSLVDATAKVDLQLDNAGSPESNILPGPAQYAVGKPGTYHLSVSLPDG
ncbi:hypothetical protein ACFQ1S_37015, partial [Kibdelosporangium lantanae]